MPVEGGIASARQESPALALQSVRAAPPLLPPHWRDTWGWKVHGNESWDTEVPLASLRADAHFAEPSPAEVWTPHLHEDWGAHHTVYWTPVCALGCDCKGHGPGLTQETAKARGLSKPAPYWADLEE